MLANSALCVWLWQDCNFSASYALLEKSWKFSCTSYYCFCVSLLLRLTHTHTRAAPTPNKANTRLGLELFLLLLLHFAIKKTLCVENNNMALRFVLQKPAATPASSFLALPFVVYRSELFIIILYTLLQLLLMFLFCCYIFLSSPTPKKRRRTETKLFAYCLLRKMENNKKMNTKKIKTEKATDVA
jgi:hypothetical protein